MTTTALTDRQHALVNEAAPLDRPLAVTDFTDLLADLTADDYARLRRSMNVDSTFDLDGVLHTLPPVRARKLLTTAGVGAISTVSARVHADLGYRLRVRLAQDQSSLQEWLTGAILAYVGDDGDNGDNDGDGDELTPAKE